MFKYFYLYVLTCTISRILVQVSTRCNATRFTKNDLQIIKVFNIGSIRFKIKITVEKYSKYNTEYLFEKYLRYVYEYFH